MDRTPLPRPLIVFGFAGILPQLIFLALVLHGGSERWFALAAACFYAALILSFLGGLWWMAAMLGGLRSSWPYGLAIAPSLIGLATLLPWNLGWNWPGPSLVVLAFALLISPVIDYILAPHANFPHGWLWLRFTMAGLLGSLTLIIATVGASTFSR